MLTCGFCGKTIRTAFIHVGRRLACDACLRRDFDRLIARAEEERQRIQPKQNGATAA